MIPSKSKNYLVRKVKQTFHIYFFIAFVLQRKSIAVVFVFLFLLLCRFLDGLQDVFFAYVTAVIDVKT